MVDKYLATCCAGAMKLVADSFPWSQGSLFAYTRDNHNSVVGMREVALSAGASAQCVELTGAAAALPLLAIERCLAELYCCACLRQACATCCQQQS